MTKTKRLINIHEASARVQPAYGDLLTSLEGKFKELQDALASANSTKPLPYYKWLDFDYLLEVNKGSKALAAEVLKHGYQDVLVVGMGGSGINSLVLQNSLKEFSNTSPSFTVQNNLDPSSLLSRLKSFDLDSTLFVFISKSGTTDEVKRNIATILNFWGEGCEEKFAKQSVFITEPAREGKANTFHEIRAELKAKTGVEPPFLENDPNIGGRFSMFCPVGMFTAELMGLDSDAMINSARSVFEDFSSASSIEESDVAKLAALDILLSRQGYETRYSMVYADSFEALNKFRAQLKGESLNKTGVAATVHLPGLGTATHHSDLELLFKKNNKLVLEQVYYGKPMQDHENAKSLDCLDGLVGESNHASLIKNHIQALFGYLVENKAPVIQTCIPEQSEKYLAQFCMQDMLVTIVQGGLQDAEGENKILDLVIRQEEVEKYKASLRK